MYIVGVDPGLAGAIAGLDAHGTLEARADTPTLTLKVQRGTRQVYDMPGMVALLQSYAGQPCQVCIEESQPMPGQGTRSMFTTGYGYGLWIGLLPMFHPCCATKPRLSVVCIRLCTSWQRLQAARAGVPVPPPATADVDVNVMAPREEEGAGSWLCLAKKLDKTGKIHPWCVRGIAPRRC